LHTIKHIKEKMSEKNELRERIIKTANTQFQTHGIKDVRMDDIATMLGISKRTLYQLFKNKEELLYEGIKYGHKLSVEKAKQLIRNANGTMDVILSLYILYLNQIKEVNKNFFRELKKYPKVVEEREKKSRQNEHKVKAWIERGIKEGIFREDTNFEVLLYILKENMEFIITTTMFDNYTIEQMSNSFILAYLRGVSTPKGQEIIEEYIKKQTK